MLDLLRRYFGDKKLFVLFSDVVICGLMRLLMKKVNSVEKQ